MAELSPSSKLSHYRIVSKIGEGGMGEVYRALDTELDRTVAIKILPELLASDQQRLQRFIQEAKAASALNHPHILTIHEIGTFGNSRFIATEFIDGETLRQHLHAPLKLTEVLEIAIQTASALAAAHAAGIIHRDIKPENIMVRRDGYVKVLDFGLAKLTEPQGSTTDTEAPTKAMVNTGAGTVMGTANYMSPEQAKGVHVDARSDIWSLGAVLYEMVAGQVPFPGETPTETISLILQKDAAPLTRFAPHVPDELERIVTKALTKDREERYQTMKDLLLDFRALKRKIEVDAEIDRTISPELRAASATVSGQSAMRTASGPLPVIAQAGTAPAASSAEYIVSGVKRHKIVFGLAVIVLVIGAVLLSAYLRKRNSEVAIESIAVLPFQNTSGDPNTEYLSDGIAESLINSLTQLQQLRVVARTTAFRYKGKDVDLQQAGRDLKVGAILSGRVQQMGDTLNIQVDLVDVTSGAQLWGEEYIRKAADVLAVKQDIAREVTDKLRLRLSGEEQKQLARRETTNAQAYQFYLKGRYYWNKRTADGVTKAIGQFQQSIDSDPNYALGYVGLADCYNILEEYAGVPSSETLPKARVAADRALQLDDTLAEAHTSSAFIYYQQWRWAEAEQEFRRAISLNPNYATTHHWFSVYLITRRRFDEAQREIKRAQELDPLSPIIATNVANLYLLKNDVDSSVEQCKKIIELEPSFQGGPAQLGIAYLKERRYEEAIAAFKKTAELSVRASGALRDLGNAYAVAGKRAEALAIVRELEARYAKREAIGRDVAYVYAGLADRDRTFEWLERDFQQRSGGLPGVAWEFGFDDLRSDPRYADLLRRMGLEP